MQSDTLPHSTGCKRLSFVDWLAGTVRTSDLILISNYLRKIGFAGLKPASFRSKFHQQAYQTPDGLVTFLLGHCEDKDKSNLEFTATALRFIESRSPSGTLQELFAWLNGMGLVARRIDLSCDDYSRSLSIFEIKRYYDEGWVKGFRNTGRLIESGQRASGGLSIRFGKRGSSGSGKSIIFYDKSIESKGKIDAIRCELSLTDERAQDAFVDLVDLDYSRWSDFIVGVHAGVIDFVDDCGEQPDWWLEYLTGSWYGLPSKKPSSPSFEAIHAWYERQLRPTLTTFRRCFGDRIFEKWLLESTENYDCSKFTLKRHMQIIEEYKLLGYESQECSIS